MKKIICFVLSMTLLACASNETTVEVQKVEETKKEPSETIMIGTYPYRLEPKKDYVLVQLEDGLSIQLYGQENQEPPYCNEPCTVYDDVRIVLDDKENHASILEDMNVLINSVYGKLMLERLQDVYVLSFDPIAQLTQQTGIIFNKKGEILESFKDVEVTLDDGMNMIRMNTWCDLSDRGCNQVSPYAKSVGYHVDGDTIELAEETAYDSKLEYVREEARKKGALVSVALIGRMLPGENPRALLNSTIYAYSHPFLSDIDDEHTVFERGDFVVAIVPTDPNASLSINSELLSVEKDVLYRSESGEPVFVIVESNSIRETLDVVIVDSKGDSITFHPRLSVNDYSVDGKLIHNFTYTGETQNNLQVYFDIAYEYLPEIMSNYAIDEYPFSESINLDGKQCLIMYAGTIQPNGIFTRERTFAICADKTIYEYDVVSDHWIIMGKG